MGKSFGGELAGASQNWTGYWRLVKCDHFDAYLKVCSHAHQRAGCGDTSGCDSMMPPPEMHLDT